MNTHTPAKTTRRGRPAKVEEVKTSPIPKVYSRDFLKGFNHGVAECRRHLTARLPYHATDWHNAIMEFVTAFDQMKDKP